MRNYYIAYRVKVEPPIREAFNAVVDRFGMNHGEAGCRLFSWFMRQDHQTKLAILGTMQGDHQADLARRTVEGIATPTI